MAKDTQFDEMLELARASIARLRIANEVRRDRQASVDAQKNLGKILLELTKTRLKLTRAIVKVKRGING